MDKFVHQVWFKIAPVEPGQKWPGWSLKVAICDLWSFVISNHITLKWGNDTVKRRTPIAQEWAIANNHDITKRYTVLCSLPQVGTVVSLIFPRNPITQKWVIDFWTFLTESHRSERWPSFPRFWGIHAQNITLSKFLENASLCLRMARTFLSDQ